MAGPAEVLASELTPPASHKKVNSEEITENYEQQLDNETEQVDYEADRDHIHELVGRKLVFYENGFFVGAISWYNRELQQFGYTMIKTLMILK